MFLWDLSANVLVYGEDFKAYVAECPPVPDVVLKVADLANFGVDLEFLSPASKLQRPGGREADPPQVAVSEPPELCSKVSATEAGDGLGRTNTGEAVDSSGAVPAEVVAGGETKACNGGVTPVAA